MALFVPFTNVAQVATRFTQQGQQVENVYHVLFPAEPDSPTLLAMCAAFKTWWVNELQSNVCSEVSLNSVIATDLTTDVGVGVEYSTGLPLLGLNTDASVPMNVTLAISWLTAARGRSFRGRTYHVGMCRTDVVGSTIIAAEILLLRGSYGALITDVATAGGVLVVASRRHAGVARTIGVATEINGVSIDNTVDSQRRRLPGRGR